MHNFIDLDGQTVSGIKVLCRHSVDQKGRVIWLCVCPEGHEFTRRGDRIRKGAVCLDCRLIEIRSSPPWKRKPRVYVSNSPKVKPTYLHKLNRKEYRAYHNAKDRCKNANTPFYSRYGGRGIKFLFESFESFLAEMGPCPDHYEIDRIDNNGNYEKGNCRWVSRKVSANNKSDNIFVLYKGETLPLMLCLESLGLSGKRRWFDFRLKRGYGFDELVEAYLSGNLKIGNKARRGKSVVQPRACQ